MTRITAIALAAAGFLVSGAVFAQSAEDLIKKHGCAACHANDKKVVGPAYVDVAAKYKGDWQFEVSNGAFQGDGGEAIVFEVVVAKILAFAKGEFAQTRYR